ncbi:hypothetical protein D3C78_1275370 [compost metagenome]
MSGRRIQGFGGEQIQMLAQGFQTLGVAEKVSTELADDAILLGFGHRIEHPQCINEIRSRTRSQEPNLLELGPACKQLVHLSLSMPRRQ